MGLERRGWRCIFFSYHPFFILILLECYFLCYFFSGTMSWLIRHRAPLIFISKSTRCSSATNVTNSRVSCFNPLENKKSRIFYLKFSFLNLLKDFFLPYFSLPFFEFSENFLETELNFTN